MPAHQKMEELAHHERLNQHQRVTFMARLKRVWAAMTSNQQAPLAETYKAFKHAMKPPVKKIPSAHQAPCLARGGAPWSEKKCSRDKLYNLLGCLQLRVDVQEAYEPYVEAFLRAVQAASTEDLDATQHSFLHTLMLIVLNDEAGHHHQLSAMSDKYSTLGGQPFPHTDVIEDRLRRWDAFHMYRELADKKAGLSSDEEQQSSDEEQPHWGERKRRRGRRGGRKRSRR